MAKKPEITNNSELDVSIQSGSHGNANLIYILYFAGIIVGVTAIVGVVMAYIGKAEADPVTRSHYENQIGIFWKGLLYSVIGVLTTFLLIGILVLIGALIWYIVRNVKGMQALSNGQAIADPKSWGF